MVPDLLFEKALVEVSDALGAVLCRDVERDLGEKEVGSDAGRGKDAGLGADGVHEGARELARGLLVELEVGRGVDKALVDGVHVHVFGAHVAQVDTVDLGRDLHVAAHAGFEGSVGEPRGDLEHAAAVAHARRLHGGADREADGFLGAVEVRHDHAGGKGVEAVIDALDRGVERLEVDAKVRVPSCHSHLPHRNKHMFVLV